MVYIKNTGDFPLHSFKRNIMQLVVDGLQMISSALFCSFIYHAMLLEDVRFKKLRLYYRAFLGFVLFYLILIFLFPDFIRKSLWFFVISRALIILISSVFYIELGRNLKVVYFRYLFAAITFLFLTGFLGIWDSTVNAATSIYTGFQYLCLGYFLENICFVGAFSYKYYNTDREKKEAESDHQMQIVKTQTEIQQQTMNYIGREIHDNIGQKLTLASLYIQKIEYENKAPQINNNIEKINTIINASIQELKELSKSLTDDTIDATSLEVLLQLECDKINDLKKGRVVFEYAASDIEISYRIKNVFLRISQEFMQNSIKHSDCQSILVSVSKTNDSLSLALEDDGIGFDPNQLKNDGIGLINMKQRAKIIGAKYTYKSQPGKGAQLKLTISIK